MEPEYRAVKVAMILEILGRVAKGRGIVLNKIVADCITVAMATGRTITRLKDNLYDELVNQAREELRSGLSDASDETLKKILSVYTIEFYETIEKIK